MIICEYKNGYLDKSNYIVNTGIIEQFFQ